MFRISYPSGVVFPKICGPPDLFWRMETTANLSTLSGGAAFSVMECCAQIPLTAIKSANTNTTVSSMKFFALLSLVTCSVSMYKEFPSQFCRHFTLLIAARPRESSATYVAIYFAPVKTRLGSIKGSRWFVLNSDAPARSSRVTVSQSATNLIRSAKRPSARSPLARKATSWIGRIDDCGRGVHRPRKNQPD